MRRLFDFRDVPRDKRALILACMLFWSVLSYLFISHYAIIGAEVSGDSMLPTLEDGDRFIINRLLYRFRDPRPGEIVALQLPGDEDLSVKRIIALPGDVIRVQAGRVQINGKPLAEPYLPADVRTTGRALRDGAFSVADNCFFVLGDNRSISEDSRSFGAVPRDWLVGRVSVGIAATRGHAPSGG